MCSSCFENGSSRQVDFRIRTAAVYNQVPYFKNPININLPLAQFYEDRSLFLIKTNHPKKSWLIVYGSDTETTSFRVHSVWVMKKPIF